MYEKALMQDEEIQIIEKNLLALGKQTEKIKILEWGSGKSTLYFTSFLKDNYIKYDWLSIEYNKKWYKKVKDMLKNDESTKIILFDVGNDNARQRYTKMEEYINYPKKIKEKFDFILIDGRKRRRCTVLARKLLTKDGLVFLHDAHRKFYHCAFRYYPKSFFPQPHLWRGEKENLNFLQKFNIEIIDLIYFPITLLRNLTHKIYLKLFFAKIKKYKKLQC